MATIQFIVNAINNASKSFNDVADSAAKMDAAVTAATQKIDAMNAQLDRAAVAAEAAARELGSVRDEAATAATALGDVSRSADVLNVAMATATREADSMAGRLNDAATAAARTSAAMGAAATGASDLERALAGTAVAARAASAALDDVAARSAVAATATRAAGGAAVYGFGVWRLLGRAIGGTVPLFGGLLPGILGSVGGLHLLVDVLFEVMAVWIPAAVAVGAWGVAASDAINDVVRHMSDMHTVSDAADQSIKPLTGDLEKMHDAVRPQVYQIFGDGLTVMAAKGANFNSIIMQTGVVLDQLSARAAVAIRSGGMDQFLKESVADVQKLGDSFGNVFGIIGNLLKAVPGYAAYLLDFGDGLLHIIEEATRVLEPIIALGLAIHGLVIWVGLAVSAVLWLGPILAGWAVSAWAAASGAVGFAVALVQLAASEGILEAATLISPLAWVAVAAAAATAVGGLIYWLTAGKSAMQQWAAAQQKVIDNSTTINQGIIALADAQGAASLKVQQAQDRLNSTQQFTQTMNLHTGQSMTVVSGAYQQASANLDQARAAQQQFNAEADLSATRLKDLARTYGSQATAMLLLNQAGITEKQWQDKSAEGWAIIKQQVAGTYAGYKAMGTQAGILGNDMQVLDKQQTDQYNAIQKVNTAWSTQIKAMTSTQSAFDTFAQGQDTLGNSAAKFSEKLGELSVHGLTRTKAAIDSLTPSGIALNSAFTAQIGNVDSLIATWRTAGVQSDLFKKGIADAIAPLEKYAKGSQEATAQLVGLAAEAGYQGPISLQALNKYLGISKSQLDNASTSTAGLKAIADQATVQEALLTTAMRNQGSYIANQLIGDINGAILKYDGVRQAAKAYGDAIAQDGRQSDAARSARTRLINDIIAAGTAAGDTKGQIAAMITKVLGIPAKKALQIVMTGAGAFSIKGSAETQAGINAKLAHLATGGLITAGTGPRADDVIIAVSRGETVVPAHLTPAVAPIMAAHGVPGFANGGLVEQGNRDVLTGKYALTMDEKFQAAMTKAMVQSMLVAMKAGEAAAAAAFTSFGGIGTAGVSNASAVAALMSAAAKMGWTGAEWAALNYVEMREAGYNIHAQNPTSGAYGMAQFINGPSEYAQFGGNSTTAAGQSVGMVNYIRSRYGDPIAAAAHERAFNWYGSGMSGSVFTSPTLIGVGDGPRPELVSVTPLDGYGNGSGAPAAAGAPLIGEYNTNYYGTGDAREAMDELTFTMRRARQAGYPRR